MREAWCFLVQPSPQMLLSPHLQHGVALQQPVSHCATPFRGWAGLCIELEQSFSGLCLACPTLSRNHHCLVPTLSTKRPVYSVSHCKPGAEVCQGVPRVGEPYSYLMGPLL